MQLYEATEIHRKISVDDELKIWLRRLTYKFLKKKSRKSDIKSGKLSHYFMNS